MKNVLIILIPLLLLYSCKKDKTTIDPIPLVEQGDNLTVTDRTAGANWTGRSGAELISFGSNMWLLGGNYFSGSTQPDFWYSPTGISWNYAGGDVFNGKYSGQAGLLHNGRMWLVGGSKTGSSRTNDVFYSNGNGLNWTKVSATIPWNGRTAHTAVSFNGKMWVMGGLDASSNFRNDIWQSTDGVNWSTFSNATWTARYGHAAVVFQNKIWVMGGYRDDMGNEIRLNDVWSSDDGSTWTLETENASWPAREYHESVVYDGKIWVIGGKNDSDRFNDIWYSEDGKKWVQANLTQLVIMKAGFSAGVHKDKIWIAGGGYDNDVYSLEL